MYLGRGGAQVEPYELRFSLHNILPHSYLMYKTSFALQDERA